MGVPDGVRLDPALSATAFKGHLLDLHPALAMAAVGNDRRACRPALRVLEDSLKNRQVLTLHNDETPGEFHGGTIESGASDLAGLDQMIWDRGVTGREEHAPGHAALGPEVRAWKVSSGYLDNARLSADTRARGAGAAVAGEVVTRT
jgi:hypothetical protein